MIRVILLILGLVFVTGCEVQRTVYLNEKGEEVSPPDQGMPDHSHRLEEVCVNGVVYYYSAVGNRLAYTPKVVKISPNHKSDHETC